MTIILETFKTHLQKKKNKLLKKYLFSFLLFCLIILLLQIIKCIIPILFTAIESFSLSTISAFTNSKNTKSKLTIPQKEKILEILNLQKKDIEKLNNKCSSNFNFPTYNKRLKKILHTHRRKVNQILYSAKVNNKNEYLNIFDRITAEQESNFQMKNNLVLTISERVMETSKETELLNLLIKFQELSEKDLQDFASNEKSCKYAIVYENTPDELVNVTYNSKESKKICIELTHSH